MRKTIIVASAIILASIPGYAFAGGGGAVTGAIGGAAIGAIVGGPVGAAVGGVAGAVTGAVVDQPPKRVVTYVEEQPVPQQPVVVQERVVVGHPLPQTIEVTPVPDDPRYAYAVVNHERVIVDPKTNTVIKVIE